MFGKYIFHIDVNSAFLSWEAVYRLKHLGGSLDLRETVSAVGGDIAKRHGIILAKSIPAKQYKIHTGEAVTDALRKCPELILVPPHYELYQKSSRAFIHILNEYTDILEQYSIDEAFMDMTGTCHLYGDPVDTATYIKDRIYRELGFTVNVGVGSNKLLAKMASDLKKPNLVHTLFQEEVRDKMWPLPVGELYFVGRATSKKLYNLGIYTIGQLAQTNLNLLRSHLKKHGEVIWQFANGYDTSPVENHPEPNKGYGNSTTVSIDVCDVKTVKMVLLALSETVASRIRKDHVKIEVVSIGIKDYQFCYASHQRVLKEATDITSEIYQAACILLDELWDGTPIRHLGIHTSRVVEAETIRQFKLFDSTDFEKLEKLDRVIDDIRRRYGYDAVKRASFLGAKNGLEHMAGGISKDRRVISDDF